MRLLVTGGCGFVGSNFVRYVLQHYGPEMITNVDSLVSGDLTNLEGIAQDFGDRYEFLGADLGDTDTIDTVLTTHQYFAVVNFASESATGLAGLPSLLERARMHGVRRFVQVSSRVPEGHQRAADALALESGREYGQEVVVTRASETYGPFQGTGDFVPSCIIRALSDEPVSVPGDGSGVRDWIHVEDHCSAIFAALLSGAAGTVYHLAGDQKARDLDLAHAIVEHLGKPRELIRLTPGQTARAADADAGAHSAHELLDWTPRKHFAPALRETVDWYVRNREWWETRSAR